MEEPLWSYDGLKQLLEEQIPYNKFLGLKLDEVSEETVTLRIPFFPELVGDPWRPALHGGVISMLIDTAGGAAVFHAVKQLTKISTVDLVVDYLRPGPLADIVAVARVVRKGNRVCIATVDVHAGGAAADGPFAQGRGVYNIAPLQRQSES